jgi:hypothetical protein
MRTRIAATAFTLTLAAAAVIAAPARAHATTAFRVYSGTGWKIATGNGEQYLGSGAWTIVFYDSSSRTALTTYAKRTATELTKNTGVTFTVTTTISKGATTCPTGRVIIMRLTSTVTRSAASQCHTLTGAADGSRATFALTNWQTVKLAGFNEIYRRQVVSHELGHSVGLAHPTTFTTSPSPLMRGDVWGGYKTPHPGLLVHGTGHQRAEEPTRERDQAAAPRHHGHHSSRDGPVTGPDGIALATLTTFAYLILNHQRKHRSTTRNQHTRRTENRHGHQDQQRPQNDTGQEGGSQAPGEEDPGPQTRR